MRIAFLEDASAGDFGPLTLTRPVFELVCGRWPLRQRVVGTLRPGSWGALLRGHLAETYRETHPEARVNDLTWFASGPTLLVNGRWLPTADRLPRLAEAAEDEVGVLEGRVAWLTLDPLEASLLTLVEPGGEGLAPRLSGEGDGLDVILERLAHGRRPVPAGGRWIERPWDLIEHNPAQLADDFRLAWPDGPPPPRDLDPQVAVLGPHEAVVVDPSASIEPFVTIDARRGPVTIDAGAAVQSFTRLEGPCHVGRGSQLFRANVRGGTTIGPVCRVGGEVEASILHGYVNKYHDGFLGHGYVGEWVNLGALTTNSDLKNDYSTVRIPLQGEAVETGLTKVGCFIGDHAKTAIGSLFNTGSAIGVMCQVLPDSGLLPRHVPSFCQFLRGELTDAWSLERNLEIARAAMQRRGWVLTPAAERMFGALYERTRPERERAVRRAAGRGRAERLMAER